MICQNGCNKILFISQNDLKSYQKKRTDNDICIYCKYVVIKMEGERFCCELAESGAETLLSIFIDCYYEELKLEINLINIKK